MSDCSQSILVRAGINLNETFDWNVRGGKTRIERARPPRKIRKSPWARFGVRDGELDVIDAINQVSWLRSRVSSHRFKAKWVKVLSQYDVANAQLLARRLLLEKLGCWRQVL